VREVDGAPVLDGTATLLAMTLAAVRIRAAAGTFVSRRRLYAKAPEAVIRSAAAEYADSYRMPALARLAEEAANAPETAAEVER
jgi:allantoin racemase